MAEIMNLKVGDVVTFPTDRPPNWNKEGKMDKFLGQRIKIIAISRFLNGKNGIFWFVGSKDWQFLLSDLNYRKNPNRTDMDCYRPYSLPIEDIRKALEPYIPPKPWEATVGDFVHTIRTFRVYKDHGNGWLEICDDNGNCLTASKKELYNNYLNKNTDFIMKAMKDAVLATAKSLLKANNTVTTLEIKTELRRDYPYYFWTQDVVSDFMGQLAGDGVFTYTDNGTYRVYGYPSAVVTKTLSNSNVFAKVAGTAPTKTLAPITRKRGRPVKSTITQNDVLNFAKDKGFEKVSISNNDGWGTYTTDAVSIRGQKKSPAGYITPKLSRVVSITVSGKTYQVK